MTKKTENITNLSTRFVTTVEERKAEVLHQLRVLRDNNYKGNCLKNSALMEFLGDTDIKDYYATLVEHLFCKKGKVFTSDEEVEVELIRYLQLCDEINTIPMVSGVCCYLGISSSLYYSILKDPTKIGFFPLQKFNEFIKHNLDVAMANNKITSSFYTLYMSHYFNVNQSANINMSTSLQVSANSTNTLNLIREQISMQDGDFEPSDDENNLS